jgi:RNA polymerase sigma factor (TIGR02999 family)
MDSSPSLTDLLAKWRAGDQDSLRHVFPLVYSELKRLARSRLRSERPNHTLQSTALVHEAYLRLLKSDQNQFANRDHLLAVAALLMRQILVDHARQRNAAKRDGGYMITLNDLNVGAKSEDVNIVALDDALQELARLDPQQSRVVELRYFGGLSIEETARALAVSPATVKREWASARIWLHRAMSTSEMYEA